MSTSIVRDLSGYDAVNSVRIAIALAALRHKPAEQSYEAYVLDLQDSFTCAQASPRKAWRERALALEKQLRDLRLKYDNEHIELETLRHVGQRPAASDKPADAEPDGKKKKAKKKNVRSAEAAVAASARPNAGLRIILDPSQIDATLPRLPSATHVLAAFETLDRLLFLRAGDKSSANESTQRLRAVAKRAVDALGDNVARLLPPNPVLPSSADALAALGTLAERLILVVLPLLSKPDHKQKRKMTSECNESAIGDILGTMATAVLLPLVRSFAPLSVDFLSALLAPSKKKQKKTAVEARGDKGANDDIRPDVFAVLDRIISTLESFAASAVVGTSAVIQRIKHVVILEAARELQDLYMDSRPPTDPHAAEPTTRSGDSQGSLRHANRLGRLARKDTLWYLCNTLQRALPLGVQPRRAGLCPADGSEQDALLEEALYGMLSRLLRTRATHTRTRRHRAAPPTGEGAATAGARRERSPERAHYERGLSEVERGMVLAVVERAWLGRCQ